MIFRKCVFTVTPTLRFLTIPRLDSAMVWPCLPYVFLDAKEYYDKENGVVSARTQLRELHRVFRARVLDVFDKANAKRNDEDLISSSEESDNDEEKGVTPAKSKLRLEVRKKPDVKRVDPYSLDSNLSFNKKNYLNDGKACRCKKVLRGYGTKHGHLVGDDQQNYSCDSKSNNANGLFCYRVNLDPVVNFESPFPTTIPHDGKPFVFQGFCVLSHQKLDKYPVAQNTRFSLLYTTTLENIPVPENFVVDDLVVFKKLLFSHILELKDWRLKAESLEANEKLCDALHFLPIFARTGDGIMEVAPMSSVLDHVIHEFRLLFGEDDAQWLKNTSQSRFDEHVFRFRGALASCPGRKPSTIRVDQIDRDTRDVVVKDRRDNDYPALVHIANRSSNLVDPNLFKAQRKLEVMRHTLENKRKDLITPEEKMRFHEQQNLVNEMRVRLNGPNSRPVVLVVLSSRQFYHTGLRSDIAQYGLLIPWIAFHYRFHISLDIFEQKLGYSFHDRNLLELALTHPSYRSNLGTNADHIRNSQANLGLRKTAYGQNGAIPKSGMKTLIHTMAQLGADEEMASPIKNYERLEFLGDAVLEFLTSVRLFLMFPDFQEGSLATFRATLVQNNHLAMLAEAYSISHFLLLSHGRERSSRIRLTDRHATANCFEAICGAIYLDGGIKFVDDFIGRSLGNRLFGGDEHLYHAWCCPPPHISEIEYPNGDRHLIPKHELLQRVVGFEELVGIQFNHIRLLANAFSSRQVHENAITIGNNQRLEFLGDTVLQLIVSDYLFKHFPTHHEGHLSLLRSSLVSNETQALVCDELDMRRYLIKDPAVAKDGHVPNIKMKDKADLVEAYLGALYMDKGLVVSEAFCKVVFFPKLTDFIGNQTWSDPKSRLQQCCLTFRTLTKGTPKLPEYKMINREGPTNNRRFEVAVYFNGERLATGVGANTKQAEKNAAEAALKNPIFLPDFQRQQSFAKRAVAAQQHHHRLNNQSHADQEPVPSTSQGHRLHHLQPPIEREGSRAQKVISSNGCHRGRASSPPRVTSRSAIATNRTSNGNTGTANGGFDPKLRRPRTDHISPNRAGPSRRDRVDRPAHQTPYDRRPVSYNHRSQPAMPLPSNNTRRGPPPRPSNTERRF